MTLHTRLHRRKGSGMYYCRVAVPHALQSRLGKREIHVSLRTTNPNEAQIRVRLESLKIDRLFAEMRGNSLPVLADIALSPRHDVTTPSSAMPFSVLLDRYLASPEKQRLTHKTLLDYQGVGRILKELIGADTPITAIERATCRFVQETLSKLPANSAKRFPNLKILEVVRIATSQKLAPMKPKNINKYMAYLSSVFEWAMQERLVDFNPARGLLVADVTRAKDKRNPFTIEQLNAIFTNDSMLNHKKSNSSRFWVPMLSLWTGARLNELCQLHTDDVVVRDGVHCLLIREGDDKRLKTLSANRIIPLHPALIELGFLTFHERAKKRNSVRLFPEIGCGVRGYIDWSVGNCVREMIEGLYITIDELVLICELVQRFQGKPIPVHDFNEIVKKIRSKTDFHAKLSLLRGTIKLSDERDRQLHTLNRIRNCLSHWGGVATEHTFPDISSDDGNRRIGEWLTQTLLLVGKESGKKSKIEFGKVVKEESEIVIRIDKKLKTVPNGERVVFDFEELNEIAFTIQLIARDMVSQVITKLVKPDDPEPAQSA